MHRRFKKIRILVSMTLHIGKVPHISIMFENSSLNSDVFEVVSSQIQDYDEISCEIPGGGITSLNFLNFAPCFAFGE